MKVMVIGARGNMGTRYSLLLRSMGHEVVGVDIGDEINFDGVTHIIVATPTDTHLKILKDIYESEFDGFILCEKPIHKNPQELEEFLVGSEHYFNLKMVDNYLHHPDYKGGTVGGDTYYNYFKHGNDGIYWDCIQLIGFSDGPVILNDNSPFFMCRLNGCELSQDKFDSSYYYMLDDWLTNNSSMSVHDIVSIHKKVAAMEASS